MEQSVEATAAPVAEAVAPVAEAAPPRRRSRRLATLAAALFALASVAFAAVSWMAYNGRQLVPQWAVTPTSPGEPTAREQLVEGVRQSMASYRYNGITVRIEQYFPIKKGRYPVIIALHGGGPASLPGGNGLRAWCRGYVQRGYVAMMPRFLDSTNTEVADPPTIDRNFVAWMEAVNHAIDYARDRPEVDPDRVGLIGWSLGSALALEVAATNPHSTAVVGNFGGMAKEITDKLKRMPPTLLLDGEVDKLYPVHLARDLYRTLKRKGVVVESKIYKGQGHGFSGEAAKDAELRTLAHFKKYLQKDESK